MPDINFTDFNPRSFEQFTQALAAAVLGPGILVFGDGPDGGREAAYSGVVAYPTSADNWHGKIVMQAKFKQRPHGDARDAAWLVQQLQEEASAFGSGDREIPDHYLLVTNVRLSGAQSTGRKGGQNKVQAAFDKHLKPLGVKNLEVWHQEKIATLLDLYPDLFRSYGAWLGTREVLSAVYQSFEARIPKFGATMLLYLQRELRSQRGTRLQQAGHVGDAAANLERVFVDLPFQVSVDPQTYHIFDYSDGGDDSGGILRAILRRLEPKLDPQSLAEIVGSSGSAPNRHLVLGGPGQGKSTVTQFLAQVMRVRLLRAEPPGSLSADTIAAINAITDRLKELGMPIEGVRRYPIRIDLPLFADAFSAATQRGGHLSLLAFVSQRIASVTDTPTIDVAILREWLEKYPFVVMLDGLDEVPPSGARREVINAIVEFWDEVASRNADVVMTVTTRPQGYNDDLDPNLYTRWDLVRLMPEQSLAYAERVAMLKLFDPERRDIVLARLKAAAQAEATAALMISPLQVAILFQLVDQRGTAPTDRWTLFHDYLSVVIKREQEKLGPGGEIIRAHETLIRRIISRVGLLLHVEAEHDGAADAFLTRKRLEAIAEDLLTEEGFEGDELTYLVGGIVTAATDRLVFLEQRTEGRIEFDVRSLQEFMAAAELMTGEDSSIRARLREIAGRTHWQHVYRIAASKAFAAQDATKFRDCIASINRELDCESPASQAVRRGAATSLDLLVDGLAIGQPKFRNLFLAHSLESLRVDHEIDLRLTSILRSMGPDAVRGALNPYLTSNDPRERRAGWFLLLACVESRNDWADALAISYWPTKVEEQLAVIMCGFSAPIDSDISEAIGVAIEVISPLSIHSFSQQFSRRRSSFTDISNRFAFLSPIFNRASLYTVEADVLPGDSQHLTFRFCPISGPNVVSAFDAPGTEPWRLSRKVAAFAQAPSIATARDFLVLLHEPEERELAKLMELPWPLKTFCKLIDYGLTVAELTQRVSDGEFGDTGDWVSAERRFTRSGMQPVDLEQWQQGVMFDSMVGSIGMPCPSQISRTGASDGRARVMQLKEAAMRTQPGATLDLLQWILEFVLPGNAPEIKLSVSEWLHIVRGDSDHFFDPSLLTLLDDQAFQDEKLIDYLSSRGEAGEIRIGRNPKELVSILPLIEEHFDREGIIVLALAIVALDGTKIKNLASSLGSRLFSFQPRSPACKDALAVLRLADSSPSFEVSDLFFPKGGALGQYAVIHLAKSLDKESAQMETTIAFLASSAPNVQEIRHDAIKVCISMLDRQRSELRRAERWHELKLPETLYNRLLNAG